jgi:hypothetical protein
LAVHEVDSYPVYIGRDAGLDSKYLLADPSRLAWGAAIGDF